MKNVEKKNLLTALYCRLSVDDFDEKDKKKNKEETGGCKGNENCQIEIGTGKKAYRRIG